MCSPFPAEAREKQHRPVPESRHPEIEQGATTCGIPPEESFVGILETGRKKEGGVREA